MRYDPFELERWLATHRGNHNLSGLGPPPVKLSEIIPPTELDYELLYGDTCGSDELRNLIAQTLQGITSSNVLVTTGTAEANFLTLSSTNPECSNPHCAQLTYLKCDKQNAKARPSFVQHTPTVDSTYYA